MADARIAAPFEAWFLRREIDVLERRAHTWWGTPQQTTHTDALWQALYRIPEPDETDAVWQVLQAMGVPWPWAAPALVCWAFPLTLTNSRLPPNQHRPLGAVVTMDPSATQDGRYRTNDGDRIRRHVEWWYRLDIADPPATPRAIEQEERIRTGQASTSSRHSTVLQGKQQAIALLDLWEPGPYHPPEFLK
jgi:hypothetical protein